MLQERKQFLRAGEQEEEQQWAARTKKYVITQQEIVFYVKDSEGVVRIIHRPLLRREDVEEGRGARRSRRRSQPDLGAEQMVSKQEGSRHIQIRQVKWPKL